jgi:hypothetical protein
VPVNNNANGTTVQPDANVEFNGMLRVDAVGKHDTNEESKATLHVDHAGSYQGSKSSFQSTQEESEKSSDDATFTSLSSKKSKDEVVEILAEVSVQKRLVLIEDVLTMCGQDVSDNTSPKTHSNNVSKTLLKATR